MQLLKFIVIGKLKDRAFQARCDEFAKWISPYAKTDLRELADSTVPKEGQAILRELDRDRDAYVIVLSEEGREFTSVDFSRHLDAIDRKVVFVIGGPYGLDPAVKARAHLLWSLSRLTFTHELARLLLFEQVFRAINISHGGHYHNP